MARKKNIIAKKPLKLINQSAQNSYGHVNVWIVSRLSAGGQLSDTIRT